MKRLFDSVLARSNPRPVRARRFETARNRDLARDDTPARGTPPSTTVNLPSASQSGCGPDPVAARDVLRAADDETEGDTTARARTATVHWLEAIYNRRRRHRIHPNLPRSPALRRRPRPSSRCRHRAHRRALVEECLILGTAHDEADAPESCVSAWLAVPPGGVTQNDPDRRAGSCGTVPQCFGTHRVHSTFRAGGGLPARPLASIGKLLRALPTREDHPA